MKIHPQVLKTIHYILDHRVRKDKSNVKQIATELVVLMEIPCKQMFKIVEDYTGVSFEEDLKSVNKFYGDNL